VSEGGGFGVAAGAVLAMGRAQADAAAQARERGHLFESMHQVPIGPIQVPIVATNGAYQMADLLSPKAGFMWCIRRLAVSGFSAGSVTIYKNGSVVGGAYTGGGEPMLGPLAAGVTNIGRSEQLLDQNDQLIIVCTGITLSAGFGGMQVNGAADCFQSRRGLAQDPSPGQLGTVGRHVID